VSVAARWEPARQRRALQLMGIELPPRRPARPSAAPTSAPAHPIAGCARLRIVGVAPPIAGDALLGGVLRALALRIQDVAWNGDAEPALPAIAFGNGVAGAVALPPVAEFRASAQAKRRAWQELRALARRVRKS
jgi:DNA polymerase III psi subunit